MLCLLCGRDRYMSRGALMLESSQCGGCGTLGNGGATLPRWMSSQFGDAEHWDTRGRHSMLVSSQFVPAWIPCRPAVGWRTWRTHAHDPFPIIPCHPVYTCLLSLAAKHLPHPPPVTPRPQRKPSCRRTELLAIKLNFCRLGSKCWRTVRRRELRK